MCPSLPLLLYSWLGRRRPSFTDAPRPRDTKMRPTMIVERMRRRASDVIPFPGRARPLPAQTIIAVPANVTSRGPSGFNYRRPV